MTKIPLLDGLRGFAACIVLVSHLANTGYIPDYLGAGLGQVGVMLFFVLSGFLMGALYLQTNADAQSLKRFALARVGRIFPLYLVVVFLSFVLARWVVDGFWYDLSSRKEFLLASFFVTAKRELWTIPVEVQFYAVFAAFWFLLRSRVSLLLPLILVGANVVIAILAYFIAGTAVKIAPTFSLVFGVGIALSVVYAKIPALSPRLRVLVDRAGIVFFVLLCVNLPGLRREFNLMLLDGVKSGVWFDPITWILILGVFYCAIYQSSSLRFLGSKVFVYLGAISFSVYILHRPILFHFYGIVNNEFFSLVIVVLLVLSVSHISHKYLELPAAERIRRF